MTNELAIRILTGDVLGTTEQTQEAITMAVRALSQPDVPETNVGDMISRQAAIKRLKEHRRIFCKDHMEFTILSEKDKARVDEIDKCIATLKNLSPAQPEPLTDTEQRIFLAAMSREEKVCRKVDDEYKDLGESCDVSLVSVCREIERKVKKALWTN